MRKLAAARQEDRLRTAEFLIYGGHKGFVFHVRHAANAANDGTRIQFFIKINEQPAALHDADIVERLKDCLKHRHAFFDAEAMPPVFLCVFHHGDHKAVAQFRRAQCNIDMAERRRIERSGIKKRPHTIPLLLVRVFENDDLRHAVGSLF